MSRHGEKQVGVDVCPICGNQCKVMTNAEYPGEIRLKHPKRGNFGCRTKYFPSFLVWRETQSPLRRMFAEAEKSSLLPSYIIRKWSNKHQCFGYFSHMQPGFKCNPVWGKEQHLARLFKEAEAFQIAYEIIQEWNIEASVLMVVNKQIVKETVLNVPSRDI